MQVLKVLTVAAFVESVYPKILCWNHWLKMTDDNYLEILERYNKCGELVEKLHGETKDRHKKSLTNNLQKSSSYFINRTGMSPVDVIRVLHSVNRLVESWRGTGRPVRAAETPSTILNCCEEPKVEEKEEETNVLTLGEIKMYFYWKFLFYGFMVLTFLQGTILVILLSRTISSYVVLQTPSCPFQLSCSFSDSLNRISSTMSANRGIETKAYPLLTSNIQRQSNNNYNSVIGRKRIRDHLALDMSTYSSGIGSDSEFEAMVNRKPLENTNSRSRKTSSLESID